jgi:hypothetical protein
MSLVFKQICVSLTVLLLRCQLAKRIKPYIFCIYELLIPHIPSLLKQSLPSDVFCWTMIIFR